MGTDANYYFDGQGPGVALNAPRRPVFLKAGALTNDFANAAAPGSFGIDTTGLKLYIQGGTLAVPAWKLVTSAA